MMNGPVALSFCLQYFELRLATKVCTLAGLQKILGKTKNFDVGQPERWIESNDKMINTWGKWYHGESATFIFIAPGVAAVVVMTVRVWL